MPFPKVKSHELASCFNCEADLSGPTGADALAALFNTLRRNWQHKCRRAYDPKVPNDTLEALRTTTPSKH